MQFVADRIEIGEYHLSRSPGCWSEGEQWIRVHVRLLYERLRDDEGREQRVLVEHGLELGNTARWLEPDHVVGEAYDKPASRMQIVLAAPIVAKGRSAP